MDALDPANVQECILERLRGHDKELVRDGASAELARRRPSTMSTRAPLSVYAVVGRRRRSDCDR